MAGIHPAPGPDRGRTMTQECTAPPRAAVAATLVTTLACVLALVLLPAAGASDVSDVAQGVAALAASIGAGWHVRRCTDRRTQLTWILVALACLSWGLGEAYWSWHSLRSDVVPFPSLADVGFLTFAVLMAIGLLVTRRAAAGARSCSGCSTACSPPARSG